MAGLQPIDSDYTNLTQDNTPLTSNNSQGLVPISYLPPTSQGREIPYTYGETGPEQAPPTQEIQSKVQGVQKPDVGKMLLLGLLGGPNAVNQFYTRTMQKQVEPIIQDISTQYRQALNAGDFTQAQKIVSQLGPLTPYSPNAGKLLESFTDIINKRQDTVTQNKIFIGNLIKSGAIKQGTAAYADFTSPGTLLQDTSLLVKKAEMYKTTGQIIGDIYTTIDPFSGEPRQQYPMPQGTKAENLAKPIQNALIERVGPTAPKRFADLQNKQSAGQITPDELNELNMLNNAIKGQAAFNIGAERLPIAERAKLNLRPGLSEEMNTPYGSVQSNIQQQGKVPKGDVQGAIDRYGTQGNINQQRIIFDTNEMVRKNLISQDQATAILKDKGITVNQPQGPYQEARQSQISGDIQEAGGRAQAQYQAEYSTKPQEQLVGYKVDKEGKLIQSPSGMSNEQLNKGNWHHETMPDVQRKILTDYAAFDRAYKQIKIEVEDNPIFRDKSTWNRMWELIGTYVQKGISLPSIVTEMRLGGMGSTFISPDRANLNAALASIGQIVEIAANPSGQGNESVAALKNVLTSPTTTPEHIMSTLEGARSIALARVKGIVGTTPGAVEEGVTGRDIRRERESTARGKDVTKEYSAQDTEKGTKQPEVKKTTLDRSKFKAVSP